MRQIYTSPRQANIERVVAMLAEHGIETRVQNRSNYQGGDWKRFSYTQRSDSAEWAQVWVVHSNDQIRARELLREAGIEPAVRYADELAQARAESQGVVSPEVRRRSIANRIRMAALIGVTIGILLMSLRSCGVA